MLHDDPMAADRLLRALGKGDVLERIGRLESRLELAQPVANSYIAQVEQLTEDLAKEHRDRVLLEARVQVLEKKPEAIGVMPTPAEIAAIAAKAKPSAQTQLEAPPSKTETP